jgi:PBSX family phage terminase large subunit
VKDQIAALEMQAAATRRRHPEREEKRSEVLEKPYAPRGGALAMLGAREPEVLIEGPTGTGKSRACLVKVHRAAMAYPGMRALIVRKTRESLTQSGLYVFEHDVIPDDWIPTVFGSIQRRNRQSYLYPNGSEVVIGGFDKPGKVMSAQYDLIYVMEATELTLEEWDYLLTRNRNNVMPWQQIIADCNPDAPTHWLNQRCEQGTTRRILGRHEDNPSVTEAYLNNLRRLTGVRRQRFYGGVWAAAEGAVYEGFDRAIHVLPRSALPAMRGHFGTQDWGFTNPGVLQVWGLDGDGRMYLVREIYMTGQTIDWWTREASALHRTYRLRRVACDPSEPEYIKQYRDAGIPAIKAQNEIAAGVNLVQQRLAPARDGRPRLFLADDCLAQRDEELATAVPPKPWCTLHEFDSYVWPKDIAGRPLKETPVDEHNHGLDALRYGVLLRDMRQGQVSSGPAIAGGQRQSAPVVLGQIR